MKVKLEFECLDVAYIYVTIEGNDPKSITELITLIRNHVLSKVNSENEQIYREG